MNLHRVISALEFFAPVRLLSEGWDNVGLLVEPSAGRHHRIERLLLTNDLTEDVLDEGIEKNVNMIVSYHPPIFSAFKRLCGGGQTAADWKQRLIVRCIERGIAIYSPHTAWDAVNGGVNDWLAGAFNCFHVSPIVTCKWNSGDDDIVKLTATVNSHDKSLNLDDYRSMIHLLASSNSLQPHVSSSDVTNALSDNNVRQFSVPCPLRDARQCVDELVSCNPTYRPFLTIENDRDDSLLGMGRICSLRERLSLDELINKIKTHLDVPYVQLAIGKNIKDTKDRTVARVALCAGSGISILREVGQCDVYWTGEMSHHDVLDAVSKGISVVLCGHSNTERGFLAHFAPKLREMLLGDVDVLVSMLDADPLVIR